MFILWFSAMYEAIYEEPRIFKKKIAETGWLIEYWDMRKVNKH